MLHFRGFGPKGFPAPGWTPGNATEGRALLAEPWHGRAPSSPSPDPGFVPVPPHPLRVACSGTKDVPKERQPLPAWSQLSCPQHSCCSHVLLPATGASLIKAKCSRFRCLMQTSLQFMCFPSEICFKNNLPNFVFYEMHFRKKEFRRKEIFSIDDRRLSGLQQAAL